MARVSPFSSPLLPSASPSSLHFEGGWEVHAYGMELEREGEGEAEHGIHATFICQGEAVDNLNVLDILRRGHDQILSQSPNQTSLSAFGTFAVTGELRSDSEISYLP